MNSYRERPAPGRALDCLWTRVVEQPGAPHRVVPDGCTDLIWSPESGALLVAGPDTAAQLASSQRGRLHGVRFRPGFGPAVFGVPGHVLRDQRVSLDELWPAAEVRRLADTLAAAEESAVDRLLVAAVTPGLRAGRVDPAVLAVTDAVRRSTDVPEIAARLGISARHLHRRSLAAFGYGPKVLHRVLRFHRALALARAGVPFAHVAATTGYADQAHLSREVRALAGVPLTALVT